MSNGEFQDIDPVSRERFNNEYAATVEGKNVSRGDIVRADQAVELDAIARNLEEYDQKSKIGRFLLKLKRNYGWK